VLALNLGEVREQIPLLANNVYLDNAGAGPPPISVYEAMRSFLDDWRDYGEKWEAWLLEIVKARELFARLINANVSEVACIPSVSYGLAAIGSALPLQREQNMVVSELLYITFLGLTLAMFLFAGKLNALGYVLAPVPLLVPCIFILLHIVVGFLQAFVFTLLPIIYVGGAVGEEH